MNEMNVAFIIVFAMSSLSCFLWQTATALTTSEMISSAQNTRAYHPRTAIAALISDVQASLQHNDLTKPPQWTKPMSLHLLDGFFLSSSSSWIRRPHALHSWFIPLPLKDREKKRGGLFPV